MVKLPKIPETSEDFNDVVSYLESGTFPTKYNTSTKRTNFQRRCKNFAYDRQKGYLFFIQQLKDENSRPVIKRVVPVYDTVLRAVLLDRKSTRLNSSHDQISYAVFCLRSKEHTSELQSRSDLVCRLLLEKKKQIICNILI